MPNTFNITDDRAVGDGPPIRTGFLDLPYELRHQIYCHLIPRRKKISAVFVRNRALKYWSCSNSGGADGSTVHVLQLSKLICEECLDILYGENTFYLCINIGAERDLEFFFAEQNRRRLRHVVFVTGPE